MDGLKEILDMLKEKGLESSYNKAIKGISEFRNILLEIKEDVDTEILDLMSKNNYLEVNSLTAIPSKCLEEAEKLGSLIEIKKDKNNLKIVEKSDKKEEKEYEFSNIITTIKGLKKGAKVIHNFFGVGEIVGFENSINSENKIVVVKFADDVEKKFLCTPEILEKYFGLKEKEEIKTLEDVEIEELESEKIFKRDSNIAKDGIGYTSNKIIKPKYFRIDDKVYEFKFWSELYLAVIDKCIEKERKREIIFTDYILSGEFMKGKRNIFSYREEKIRKNSSGINIIRLKNGVYAKMTMDSLTMVSVIEDFQNKFEKNIKIELIYSDERLDEVKKEILK